jgi:hypothetical protein
VYQVRRLIAVIAIIGAGVGISGVISAVTGGGTAQPQATSSDGTISEAAACDPAAIVISANTDHDTYAEGDRCGRCRYPKDHGRKLRRPITQR